MRKPASSRRAPERQFVYTGNGAYITAEVRRRPRKGVPRCDTVRLRFVAPGSPDRSLSVYMRPDEAVAVASCVAAAAWQAQAR